MSFSTWLRYWKRSLERRSALKHTRRCRPPLSRVTLRPRLELLEDRTLLSAYNVTTTADSGPDSLRDAITQINADTSHTLYTSPSNPNVDEIDFNITAASDTGGGYDPNTGVAKITLSGGELLLTNSVIINGPDMNELIIDSGHHAGQTDGSRILEIGGGNVTLSGLTIQNGDASGSNGGGILVDGAGTLTVNNLNFSNNIADVSGGAVENDGTLTVSNSIFSGNQAMGGGYFEGGGAIENDGTLTVSNSTFSGNQAMGGGYDEGFGGGGGILQVLPDTLPPPDH